MNIEEYKTATGQSDSTVRRKITSGAINATKENGRWNIEAPTALTVDMAKDEVSPPRNIGGVRPEDWWQRHPFKNLTPQRLSAILLQAEQGIMWDMADLYDDVLERDPLIASLLMVRKSQVLAKGWDILPNDDTPKAQKQADFIKDALLRLSDKQLVTAVASQYMGFDELLSYLFDAKARGFATAELEWDTDEKWIIRAAKQIHQRHFKIGDMSKGEDYNPYELRLRTVDNDEGELLPPFGYITHYDFTKSGYTTRQGLLRPSLWYYLYKHHGMKWFVRYAEIAAIGMMIAKYDPLSKTKDQDIADIKAAMADMGAFGYGVLPKDASFEFKDAARGAGGIPQEQLLDYCDKALTILWLGQTGVTMPVASKLGEEGVQQDVLFDIMEADAISLMGTIQRSIVTPMAEFNDGSVLCHFNIPFKPEDDQKAAADTLKVIAVDLGLPVSEDYAYETLSVPPPGEGDKIITPAAPAAPMAFNKNPLSFLDESQQISAILGYLKNGGSPEYAKAIEDAALDLAKKKSVKANRLERDANISKGVESIEGQAVKSVQPLYDKLTSGVTEKNFKAKLESNKKGFIKEYEKRAGKELGKIDTLFNKEFPKAVDNAPGSTVKIAFDLQDKGAVAFQQWQTFTMSQLEGELITKTMINQIDVGIKRGLKQGETFNTFLKTIKENMGISKVNPSHLKTVWQTNLATAHSVSTLDQINKGDFVGWEFLAISDSDTTDICNDRNGNKYPIDNKSDFPPLHFNCRSEGSPFTREEADEEGYKLKDVPKSAAPPEKGFKNNAVTNYNQWVANEAKALGIQGKIKSGLPK